MQISYCRVSTTKNEQYKTSLQEYSPLYGAFGGVGFLFQSKTKNPKSLKMKHETIFNKNKPPQNLIY